MTSIHAMISGTITRERAYSGPAHSVQLIYRTKIAKCCTAIRKELFYEH